MEKNQLDKVKSLMCRIDESYRRYNPLIVEGAETKNMKVAKHYLYQNKNCNEKQAMQIIGAIKTDVPNVRNAKCKFILALTRMYCEGQLSDGKVIRDINTALKYITSNAHVNEYDQNLNGLSAKEIIDRFSGVAQQDLEQDKANLERQDFTQSNNANRYEIVKITSFEEAEEYGEFTEWCVTHDEGMFETYTSAGGVFYFCLRDDYESVERVAGENCPLDDYGLSMIATSVNADGSCNTITCRWNHANGGNDSIMTPEELSRVVGRNYYKTFLPLTPEEIELKKQKLLWEIDEELYDDSSYYDDIDEYADELTTYDPNSDNFVEDNIPVYHFLSRYRDKHVLIDAESERISDEVFDGVGDRYGNYVEVEVYNGNRCKYNYVDVATGKLVFDTWFDYRRNYFDKDGYAIVGIDNKGETIFSAKNGALADEWFEALSPLGRYVGSAYRFKYDRVMILKNNKYNIVNPHDVSHPIFPEWFDDYRSIRTQEGKVIYAFRYGNIMKIQDLFDGKQIIPYDFTELKFTYDYMPLIKLTNGQWCVIKNDFTVAPYTPTLYT